MKKLNAAAVVLMMAAVCSAGGNGQRVDFDGGAYGACFMDAVKAVEVPAPAAAQSCYAQGSDKGVSSAVKFSIHDGFYGAGSMAAFDLSTGNRAAAYKNGAGWKTEVTVNGEKAAGKVAVQGQRYTYVSGDTAIVLERRGGAYVLGGLPGASAVSSGGEALAIKGPGLDLAFNRMSVGGLGDARQAAALAALYLVALRESAPGIFRSVDFQFRGEVDENGGGWTSCSNTGENWTTSDTEYRVTQHDKQDQYVCRVDVTWSCSWRSCRETNPHTNPGQCYCRAACSKSSNLTSDCSWQSAE